MRAVLPDPVILGNVTIDDLHLLDGSVVSEVCGGNVVYAGLGAVRWGSGADLYARVGRGFPDETVRHLAARGARLRLISVGGPNLLVDGHYRADGRYFGLRPGSGSYQELALHPADLPPGVALGRVCHVAPMPVEAQRALVRSLRREAALLMLDPHHDDAVDRPETVLDVLPDVDVFLPSRDEAAALSREREPEAQARDFARRGARVIVVKLDRDGCLVLERENGRVTHLPPARLGPVCDVTGAGDAFCGGLAAALARGADVVAAAAHGAVSAAVAIGAVGALAPDEPEPAELERSLRAVLAEAYATST